MPFNPQGLIYTTSGTTTQSVGSVSATNCSATLSNESLIFSAAANQPLGIFVDSLVADATASVLCPGLTTGVSPPTYTAAAQVLTQTFSPATPYGSLLIKVFLSTTIPVVAGEVCGAVLCLYDSTAAGTAAFFSAPVMWYNGSVSTGSNISCKKFTLSVNPASGQLPATVNIYACLYAFGSSTSAPAYYPVASSTASSSIFGGLAPTQIVIQQIAV